MTLCCNHSNLKSDCNNQTVKDKNIISMDKIFQILCGCLAQIGRPFGWSYEKISVYICIHLWPLLCVVMALVMLGIAVSTANPLWITACIIYFLFTTFGYWAVIKHYYPGTINEIFTHCYSDLMTIAKEWNTSYAIVNLVIYVLAFILIMAFDVSLIVLML